MDLIKHVTFIEKGWHKIKAQAGGGVQVLLFQRPQALFWLCHVGGLQMEEIVLHFTYIAERKSTFLKIYVP